MKKENVERLVLLAIFATAMGYLEATVVYYLHLLPVVQDSFNLPAIPNFPKQILPVEQFREETTMIMLASVSMLAVKNNRQRLLAFIFTFGIWDLVYYASLYLLMGWPKSLFDLDVVFLIPIQWVFPVYFPITLFTILTFFTGYKILKGDKK